MKDRQRKRQEARVDYPIDVLASGAVLLGPTVTCDGFHSDRRIRIQTHIHSDHMNEFSTSLRGEVLMTKPTMRLLEYDNPALSSRANVHALEYGEEWKDGDCRIQLFSSDHVLGGAQAKVTLKNGMSVGYSSDFNWPLEDVIKVDALVVDATYGNPISRTRYKQGDAQEAFIDLVRKKRKHGPIHLMADTGPLERALVALAMSGVIAEFALIGNKRVCWHADVNRHYRRPIPEILCDESRQALNVLRSGYYVRIWSLNSPLPNDGLYSGTVIYLTKYRASREPIQQIDDDVFHVGLSNHADFGGTIEYVRATGAKFVITDNQRGESSDRAEHLAKVLRAQLGIRARVSSNFESREWGK